MEKEKGYYVYFLQEGSIGAGKKINSQIKVFEDKYEMTKICTNLKRNTVFRKITRRFIFGSTGYDFDSVIDKIEDPKFIYVRRTTADKDYIKFFKTIRKKFPECKIIIEIFTYPYDKDEYNRNFNHFLHMFWFYAKDVHYRKKLRKYIDRFVTYSNDDVIFNVPTIKTVNGIDVDGTKPVLKTDKTLEDINMISVARMQVHHGYERVLTGLSDYYKNGGKRNFIYHVVGDGKELPYYKEIVKNNGLGNHVIFYGAKVGDELDEIYDKCDISVSSLGLYKYKINLISPLKVGEYFAKGVPTINGCNLSIYNDKMKPFICQFENNETPIDFFKVEKFVDDLYAKYSKEYIVDTMRECAKEFCDMKVTLNPVLDYIEKGN